MDFRVLGPLEVVDGGQLLTVPSRRARSLLGLLILHPGRSLSVDAAVDGLWGDLPPRTALNLVQGMVSELRRLLDPHHGGLIETVPAGYRLNVEPHDVDASRFERMTHAAMDRLEAEPHEAAPAFGQALAMWRGRAFGDLADETAFQGECARLEEARLMALEGRLQADLALGRHVQIVGELEALVAEHPLRERLRYQLMLALYRAGRQAEALRVYERGRRLLADELGINPSPDLRRLEQAVLVHAPELQWSGRRSDTTSRPPAPTRSEQVPFPTALADLAQGPFVGRAQELSFLNAAWERTMDGRPQAVFVRGEPGAGKSRLIAELALSAHRAGAMVLHGRCDEDAGIAYQPFVDALGRYVRWCPIDELNAHVESHGGELARLVPDLRRRIPSAPEPAPAEPDFERWRLFEAVTYLLADLSRRGPVVLVLDDVHWAAAPSILLLKHLLRSGEMGRVFVLVAYRDTELQAGHGFTGLLADLRSESGIDRLALGGLDPAAVATYLETLGGQPLGPSGRALASDLHSVTEGNPLFLIQLLRHLSETGVVRHLDGRWHCSSALGPDLPEGVREVVLRRLSRLSGAANRALAAAAVVGLEFEYRLLERIRDASSGSADLLDALDEAERAGLVASVPESPGLYRFTHNLARHVLLSAVSPTRRALMHAQVANAMESTYEGMRDAYLPQLAFHFAEAGWASDDGKAVHYGALAGEAAMRSFAYEDAVVAYRRALESLPFAPSTDDSRRVELLLALGTAQYRSGEAAGARVTCRRALDTAQALGSPTLVAQAATSLVQLPIKPDAALLRCLEDSLERMPTEDSALRVRVLTGTASVLDLQCGSTAWHEHIQRARRLADEALEMARRLGNTETLWTALWTWHIVYWCDPDRVDDRLAVADELVELARRQHDKHWSALARFRWVGERFAAGDVGAVREEIEVSRQERERLFSFLRYFTVAVADSALGTLDGRFEEAEEQARDAFALAERDELPDEDVPFGAQLIAIRQQQGRFEEVIARAEQLSHHAVSAVHCLRAEAALARARLGQRVHARKELEEMVPGTDWSPEPGEEPIVVLAALAELCWVLDDGATASRIDELLLPYPGRHVTWLFCCASLGSSDRYLGQLATMLGRFDEAEADFEAAHRMHERMGARPWLAHGWRDHARMLRARRAPGDEARATELLVAARDEYRRLRMTYFEAEADTELCGNSDARPRVRSRS